MRSFLACEVRALVSPSCSVFVLYAAGGACALCSCHQRLAAPIPEVSDPQRCLQCHVGVDARPLAHVHLEGGFVCTDCHHFPERSAVCAQRSLTPTERRTIDESCRACHTERDSNDLLFKRFLHWRSRTEKGFYEGRGAKRCIDCHHHSEEESREGDSPTGA